MPVWLFWRFEFFIEMLLYLFGVASHRLRYWTVMIWNKTVAGILYPPVTSAVFSDFATHLQGLSCGPRGWPNIFGERSTQVRFFLIFWLRIVHVGLVLLWHMIRQFTIHVNFLQTFYVHSRPLARSAAHPQLQVLRGLKHGTACYTLQMTVSIGLLR